MQYDGLGRQVKPRLTRRGAASLGARPVSNATRKGLMNGTVLILDDDAGVLELTDLHLRSRGFPTLTCHSAASALKKLRDAGGDVEMLIADVNLPESSGVEVAFQLRALT